MTQPRDIEKGGRLLKEPVSGAALSPLREEMERGNQVRILSAVRRLIRAMEINSRRLISQHNITGPQLDCLLVVANSGPISTTSLARQVVLSPSTVVGIIDRLEQKGLVSRCRDTVDRRVVRITITGVGSELAHAAPSSFMEILTHSLETMPAAEQTALTEALERLVGQMEPGDAPLLKKHPVP